MFTAALIIVVQAAKKHVYYISSSSLLMHDRVLCIIVCGIVHLLSGPSTVHFTISTPPLH
jgi:hypothetical protein